MSWEEYDRDKPVKGVGIRKGSIFFGILFSGIVLALLYYGYQLKEAQAEFREIKESTTKTILSGCKQKTNLIVINIDKSVGLVYDCSELEDKK